ncbi:MAG: NAD(P)-dependent oxidoreductase [Candidatus Woesebacteria bacterium]|nr:NAD(P)-dependent oxidoreductase [Candidatus Woesebacteria bacterium]
MKVLLTGSTGLLGEHIIENLSGCKILATYHHIKPRIKTKNVIYHKLDLANKKGIYDLIKRNRPEVIIHTASIGNVDYCETHKKEARQINCVATKNLFLAGKKINAKFVFFSTNAIFDGENPPYNEDSATNPLDYYGKTKLETEKFLLDQGGNTLIIRLMTMYGWNNPAERNNPVTWIINMLKNGKKIKVVNDIFNNYLYVEDAIEVVWRLLIKSKQGIYNVAGSETINRFELAKKIAKLFKLPKELIEPVTSSYFPQLAPRPKDSSFDIRKIIKETGYMPKNVEEGLLTMKSKYRYG